MRKDRVTSVKVIETDLGREGEKFSGPFFIESHGVDFL